MKNRLYIGGYLLVAIFVSFYVKPYAVWNCLLTSLVLLVVLFRKGGSTQSLKKDMPRDHMYLNVLDSLFEHNPNAIGIFDQAGKFIRINLAAETILGYSVDELLNQPFISFVTQEQLERTSSQLEQVKSGTPVTFETAVIHKSGYRVDLNVTAVPVDLQPNSKGNILICQDITERKRGDEQVRYMAYYDDMTGLPNRRMFRDNLNERLSISKSIGQKVAVFYLDIDRFKLVNDSFGYDYGNMLLLQLAERFTRCVTDNDYLARTEGDEFAFFYTNVADSNDVIAVIAEINRVLEKPFLLEQYELHITASIGVAISSDDADDADILMKYADIALARAKEKGRNDFQIFNTDMKSVSINRLKLESELRRAIVGDEFVLYYQPQVDIETGRIVGVEALIRWDHPGKGLISPNYFIPFAEESGLIVPIGEWVLRAACKQNKAWQNQGYPMMPISVNLSMRQFFQHNLKGKIRHVLEQTGLDPQYLELEITESMTMDVDHAIQSLLELKELGVNVSIDDFGTGYSSLYYLKKFPIDKLKIDRSFVRDIMVDPNDAAIVATIIAMTHHLNLKVIAEGVETEDQLHFLHENRCNEVQGYWFSPPVSADELEKMLKTGIPNASAASVHAK
ncbi:sensor domain-containing protein [Paenibacillus alginolyticus]|uniref:EAL domain-containing protein n=1 Tax=Paenibacillus alginolyticus TaxID=59839 RepID=A0ABT4G719_9BACL|nr:GGDEF domain-containing phosphodiesterase [Paenibacillus alginolyticus]MCY9691978.1 EAL domain-containing protein [Paenibacillus alginolyticus]MEC0144168.1 EAL domain-containing protein [Paenibacillus alginolyticus]